MENFFNEIANAVTEAWNGLVKNIDGILLAILEIILIIIIAKVIKVFGVRFVKKMIKKRAEKKPDTLSAKKLDTLSVLFENIIKYVIIFLEVTAILSVLGLGTTVSSLLATAGIGGLAIGLGAQSLISDSVNGFFMLLDDEYAVGDFVEIFGFKGTVESISIRTTRLKLPNNEIVTIPNGKIDSVVNYTRDSYLLFVDMLISVEEDTTKAGAVMLEVANSYAKDNRFISGEAAFVGAIEINSVYQKLRISVSLEPLQQWKAERELRAAILDGFKKNDIKIPNAKEGFIVKE